ncbi:MAG: hypothetical protein HY319_18605 [Armatimonadetes bacterium]|nr:hypothetical protein [Armatimonadota bacterium]
MSTIRIEDLSQELMPAGMSALSGGAMMAYAYLKGQQAGNALALEESATEGSTDSLV